MPTNDYRLEQISLNDLSAGANISFAFRPKRSIQSDAIDGDEARGQAVSVPMTAALRQALKAHQDLAAAKMDFRRAAKASNPAVDLTVPQAGEP